MVFYFSGTGNSRWVAQNLAEMLHQELVNMAEVDSFANVTGEDAYLGFVFPVYGWDVPEVVKRFVREKLVCNGQTDRYVFLVATCGDDTGRMQERFNDLLREKDLILSYCQVIKMPNTYVCLPFFDIDAEQLRRSKLKHSEDILPAIQLQIKNKIKNHFDSLPGKWPWFKTYILGCFFRRWLITDKKFRVNDACVHCGLCVKACSLKNIKLDKTGHPQWNSHCTMCLSCYHHCERHAIEWGGATRGKGQYLFPRQ